MKLEKSKSLFTYYSIPIGFFLLIFLTTIYAYLQTRERGLLLKRQVFEFRTQLAKSSIERRFIQNVQLLRGAKAFFESSDYVSRKQWEKYIATLELEEVYPGIQGTGFAKVVYPGEVNAHINEIRAQGFPDYTITPAGDRPIYMPIIYLEPFEGRNLSAFGFDMYSDSIRRETMDKAWKTGQPAISGKLTLVQEITEIKQPGFLMYLPVYSTEGEPANIQERLSSLVGFVYNPFRAHDLMNGIFRDHYPDLDIEVYDGATSKENLLYDKVKSVSCLSKNKNLHSISKISIAQRTWTICFTVTPQFGTSQDDDLPIVILAGGSIIALLVLISTFVLMDYLRSKQQVIKEAERTKFLAEAMPQKVWTADAKGNKNYFNQRWIEYSGTKVEKLINGEWEEKVHKADFPELKRKWDECLKLGKDFQMENRLLRFNGEYRWHLSKAMPQKDKNNRIIMWVGTDTEIHDQKSQTEELKRINADLDNFVYTASHDLKAPVSNIEGLIGSLEDYLNEKGIVKGEANTMIQMIKQSVNKFRETIKDLTEITKIQKNLEDDVSNIDCQEIVNDVKFSISDMISGANAVIQTHLENCREIKFSRKNLKSIIYNLLTNAIKYRSPDRKPEIHILSGKVEGYYLLSVRDNGLGLAPEQKQKIFTMFKRLHTHVEGTGIGLYIVKRIVENAGGKIEVESEKGVGSIFKVYIPQT